MRPVTFTFAFFGAVWRAALALIDATFAAPLALVFFFARAATFLDHQICRLLLAYCYPLRLCLLFFDAADAFIPLASVSGGSRNQVQAAIYTHEHEAKQASMQFKSQDGESCKFDRELERCICSTIRDGTVKRMHDCCMRWACMHATWLQE